MITRIEPSTKNDTVLLRNATTRDKGNAHSALTEVIMVSAGSFPDSISLPPNCGLLACDLILLAFVAEGRLSFDFALR